MGLAGAALEEWQGLWPGFGAGEGVSPKTQGVAGSEVTQAVQLGCRLVPDALKTPSSQCVLSVCVMFPGRHEVNTCTPKTVAAPPHCWEVLSASRPPVQGRGLWAHVALRNPSLGSWVPAFALLGTLAAVQATREHMHGEAVGFLTEQRLCCQTAPAFRKFFTLTPGGPHPVY